MTNLTLNLPKYRLHIRLAKRRGGPIDKPLFPELETIKNVRRGNKLSRYFRHIFEHKDIRKILGANMALVIVASSLLPTNIFADTPEEETVIAEAVIPLTTEHSVQYPVESVKITQGYTLFHPGIDFDGITGDSVRPIKNGIVEAVSRSKYAYGNAIIVNHGNKLTSLYAHLSKINVLEGDGVTTDTIIGELGATGHASGDHLHLEIRDNGRPVNPSTILPR
jgi:murein DD-endopeptidase MepM/ murein hydrolase activator NlpD